MNIKEILKKHKKSITKERLLIFEFLSKKNIFNYSDVEKEFGSIGRSSIFRTLKLFLEIGIIRKVELGTNAFTYELINTDTHYEYMKCENCRKIISFCSKRICSDILAEANKKGFHVKSHNVGIVGLCNNCY